MVQVFQMIAVPTTIKIKSVVPDIETKAISNYQMQMAGFLPRFSAALGQEKATWGAVHSDATPDEVAAFDTTQATALTDFAQQLAAWHDAFVSALGA
jgi:hypothetical protein